MYFMQKNKYLDIVTLSDDFLHALNGYTICIVYIWNGYKNPNLLA